MNAEFKKLGFMPADILLPKNCEMEKWSVVACDQYTAQPEYWEAVKAFVGGAPSTLHMILPEAQLSAPDADSRIGAINASMDTYLQNGVFKEIAQSFVLVSRTQKNGEVRTGLVGAVDLEAYDYRRGASSLIRATEGTVLERIPPRVRVREGASLESPHVMLLIDDPGATVIEPLAAKKAEYEKLYDFALMQESGHLCGYRVAEKAADGVARALQKLATRESFTEKYGIQNAPVLLYAVGDGNHSLATAKECWERVKKTLPAGVTHHPARYALVELVNIHDASLNFEPIHRVVFGVDPEKLVDAFLRFYKGAVRGEGAGHRIEYVYAGARGVLSVPNPQSGLPVGTLQNFLDACLRENGGTVDYIHGEDVVRTLGEKPGNIGFLLPPMGKSELFKTVVTDGVLPRKTFSMGHACDKRFYLECRKIK